VLPQEIQEKLSHTEEDYFKKHSTALQAYMSRLDLDLTVVTSLTLSHTQT
jgi:GINS complex subunit 1